MSLVSYNFQHVHVTVVLIALKEYYNSALPSTFEIASIHLNSRVYREALWV